MQDKWGYAELVVHPPPINYLTFILLPNIFKNGMMARAAEVYSKMIFWLENTVYLVFMFLYELLLVPFIFLRLIYNIFRVETFFYALLLVCLWLFFGLFYLLYNVGVDMYYFFKILCDYKEDDDAFYIKQEEDEK